MSGEVSTVVREGDRSCTLLGPLLMAGMIALSGYRLAFAVLAIPGVLAVIALARLRAAAPRPAGIDLTGRRAIVTGASSGIGIETARALAGAGAQVTLAVRNTQAGSVAAADIASTTGATTSPSLRSR
jgi:short chain dehydrogenase